MIDITLEEFESKLPTDKMLVMFYSDICEKCKIQKEILDYHKIKYYGIVCDEDPELFITKYNVDMVPEIRFYECGDMIWNRINAIRPEDLDMIKLYEKSIG